MKSYDAQVAGDFAAQSNRIDAIQEWIRLGKLMVKNPQLPHKELIVEEIARLEEELRELTGGTL